MKKTHKVVILPTEKASNLIYNKNVGILDRKELRFKNDNARLRINDQYQHLYILSDEEIKEGDWFITATNDIFKCTGTKEESITFDKSDGYSYITYKVHCKKIVATTDTSLTICEPPLGSIGMTKDTKVKYLPELPESFIQAYIKAYNEGKPITEVDLEGQYLKDGSFHIHTRMNNTVIVHQSKMYSRNEVENLIQLAWATCSATIYKEGDNIEADCRSWINTHLK